ncbi:glycosyltransferase family 2 protein [Halomonas salinarum]|uniref:glycosyltransferase family 2 protein n=1 Tax=Halomonas salinarum TaxID=1158993 RepID=UPI00143B5321|nr:glycosyltransferase family 2 protein [Halomonas salinarum]
MHANKIVAIILTKDEELHLARCVESLKKINAKVVVVDSGSSDLTCKIAKENGCEVYFNPWVNYSHQFNYALNNFVGGADWVFRIDADEYIDDQCAESICKKVEDESVNAIYLNRYICFKGRLLKQGGMSKYYMLRLWRGGLGYCENRWMDEHIVVEGENSSLCDGKLVDESLKPFGWWLEKHVGYAKREAVDVLNQKFFLFRESAGVGKNSKTRFFKKIFNILPIYIRSWVLFFYRYVILGGFLDGRQGYEWAFMQTLWYRNLVDMNVKDVLEYMRKFDVSCSEAIQEKLDIKVV